MRIIKLIIFIIIFGFSTELISQSQSFNPAQILQSFKPRDTKSLLPNFIRTCEDNRISLLLVVDKMGNKSKKTRFTTYQSQLIYQHRWGTRKLTYNFYFKDDTLMNVQSYAGL
jgi:hypothetical protein